MNPWIKDMLNFAAWCVGLFVILVIYLHAANAIDIDISYDGDVTIISEGLTMADTLTINGEIVSGTLQWEDAEAWYSDTWLNGQFYRRHHVEVDLFDDPSFKRISIRKLKSNEELR